MASVAPSSKRPVAVDADLESDDEPQKKLSERIANWARFTLDRRWPSATCMSIEGRYRRSTAEDNEHGSPPSKWAPDVADAWEIEDSWRELPDVYRFTLQWVYLRRWDQRKVWRKLAPHRNRQQLRFRDFDEVLRLARFSLSTQLRRRKNLT